MQQYKLLDENQYISYIILSSCLYKQNYLYYDDVFFNKYYNLYVKSFSIVALRVADT